MSSSLGHSLFGDVNNFSPLTNLNSPGGLISPMGLEALAEVTLPSDVEEYNLDLLSDIGSPNSFTSPSLFTEVSTFSLIFCIKEETMNYSSNID